MPTMKNLLRAGALALALFSCAPLTAQSDQFPDSNVSSPCRHWETLTPSDSTTLTRLPKAIYIGSVSTGATLALIGVDAPSSATGVAWPVTSYQILPVRPRKILATGTTGVSSVIACY